MKLSGGEKNPTVSGKRQQKVIRVVMDSDGCETTEEAWEDVEGRRLGYFIHLQYSFSHAMVEDLEILP